MNANETALTSATLTIEELCQAVKSVNSEESGDIDEEADEEPPVPMFGEAV